MRCVCVCLSFTIYASLRRVAPQSDRKVGQTTTTGGRTLFVKSRVVLYNTLYIVSAVLFFPVAKTETH